MFTRLICLEIAVLLCLVVACSAAPHIQKYETMKPQQIFRKVFENFKRDKRQNHPVFWQDHYGDRKADLQLGERENEVITAHHGNLPHKAVYREQRSLEEPEKVATEESETRRTIPQDSLRENVDEKSEVRRDISDEPQHETSVKQEYSEIQFSEATPLVVVQEASSEAIEEKKSQQETTFESTTKRRLVHAGDFFYSLNLGNRYTGQQIMSRDGYFEITPASSQTPLPKNFAERGPRLREPETHERGDIIALQALARFLSGHPKKRESESEGPSTPICDDNMCYQTAKPPPSPNALEKAWRVTLALDGVKEVYESAARLLFAALRGGQEKTKVWLNDRLEDGMRISESSEQKMQEVGSRIIDQLVDKLRHPIRGSLDDLTKHIWSTKAIHVCFSQLWFDIAKEASKITASIPEDELQAFQEVVQYIQPCLVSLASSTASPDMKITTTEGDNVVTTVNTKPH